ACHAAAAGGEWPSTHSTLGNVDERSPEEVGGAAGRVAPDGSRLDCAPRTHRIHSYVNGMPLYEYRCLGCGHQFELLLLRSSQAAACPACQSESVERLVSSFAVSSQASHDASVAAARRHNAKLNAKQDPDKPRVQIDHPHLH